MYFYMLSSNKSFAYLLPACIQCYSVLHNCKCTDICHCHCRKKNINPERERERARERERELDFTYVAPNAFLWSVT